MQVNQHIGHGGHEKRERDKEFVSNTENVLNFSSAEPQNTHNGLTELLRHNVFTDNPRLRITVGTGMSVYK